MFNFYRVRVRDLEFGVGGVAKKKHHVAELLLKKVGEKVGEDVGKGFSPFLVFTCVVHLVFVSNFTFISLSLSLRDFLPRGSGIVTRRPLILQLVNSKAGEFRT